MVRWFAMYSSGCSFTSTALARALFASFVKPVTLVLKDAQKCVFPSKQVLDSTGISIPKTPATTLFFCNGRMWVFVVAIQPTLHTRTWTLSKSSVRRVKHSW